VDADGATTIVPEADVKSCGSGIPTLMLSRWGDDPGGDGGQQARCTEKSTI
jgi:hypothetical protein